MPMPSHPHGTPHSPPAEASLKEDPRNDDSRVELTVDVTARGQTYCRAGHEVRDRRVVMAIRCKGDNQKVNGEWRFGRGRERHLHSKNFIERPRIATFDSWASRAPNIPHCDASWSAFWCVHDTRSLSRQP
jgi:hypothetical protein